MRKKSDSQAVRQKLMAVEKFCGENKNIPTEDYYHYQQYIEAISEEQFWEKLNTLYNTPVGKKICRFKNGISFRNRHITMNDKDWCHLESAIEQLFPDLMSMIKEKTERASRQSFRLALLCFFNLRIKSEYYLLGGKSDNAVRQNRDRLKKCFNTKNLFNFYKKTYISSKTNK